MKKKLRITVLSIFVLKVVKEVTGRMSSQADALLQWRPEVKEVSMKASWVDRKEVPAVSGT